MKKKKWKSKSDIIRAFCKHVTEGGSFCPLKATNEKVMNVSCVYDKCPMTMALRHYKK